MLQGKISFYEDMSVSTICPKSKKKPKTANTKYYSILPHKADTTSLGGITHLQKALRDFTEIKRPQAKSRKTEVLVERNAIYPMTINTVPRRKRDSPINDTLYPQQVKCKIGRSVSEVTRLGYIIEEKPSEYNPDNNENDRHDDNDVIEKQVEEFGQKLRSKVRSTLTEKQVEEYDQKLRNEFGALTLDQIPYPDINVEKIGSDYNEKSTFSPICINGAGKRESQIDDALPIAPKINDECVFTNTESFGLNEFSENSKDNFIVEAYNKLGSELVIVAFEIKRRLLKLCASEEPSFEEFQDEYNMLVREDTDTHEIEVLEDDGTHSNLNLENNWQLPNEQSLASPDSGIETKDNSVYSETSSISDELLLDAGSQEDLVHKVPLLDNKGNVGVSKTLSSSNLSQSEILEAHKSKLSYIVDEFIRTEEQYINGLRKVVHRYIPYIEEFCPRSLLGKTPYLFGNIERIYEESKGFLGLLKKKPDEEGIANAIIISASMFDLHPKYSQNKPTADEYIKKFDHIIKERQKDLNDKLDLASYLLTPIQRLGKYILMLDNIKKELLKVNKSTTNITKALEIIRRAMKKGNDSIAIDSITNCPVNLELQGSFIMRETFTIHKPKKFESMVFLFENIVVFTENNTKMQEKFVHIDNIMMTDLSIANIEDNPLVFHLSNFPKNKGAGGEKYTFVLEASKEKIKKQWTESIQHILWRQLIKVRKYQEKLYSSEGKRYSKVELPKKKNRDVYHKKTSSLVRQSSKFYVDKLNNDQE